MSDGFWDWAVAAYAAPGVSETCLSLQDLHDQNVPLLLWAGWAATSGRRPDEDTLDAACDTARAWSDTTIAPLRAVRRTLKSTVLDMADADREVVRERVKALELDAERRLMTALEALSPEPDSSPREALEGLVEVARLWARAVPRPALKQLADRLPA